MLQFLTELFGGKTRTPSAPAATTVARPGQPAATNRANRQSDRRKRYITIQSMQLAERFSRDGGEGIVLDEENFDWLVIPKYPMPARWKQRWTSLMLLLPTAYPDVPPMGFYLTIKGGLRNGQQDSHLFSGGGYYEGAPDHSSQGWYWYCVHANVEGSGGWRPSADPRRNDNLFTFLNMAREALTTDH